VHVEGAAPRDMPPDDRSHSDGVKAGLVLNRELANGHSYAQNLIAEVAR